MTRQLVFPFCSLISLVASDDLSLLVFSDRLWLLLLLLLLFLYLEQDFRFFRSSVNVVSLVFLRS